MSAEWYIVSAQGAQYVLYPAPKQAFGYGMVFASRFDEAIAGWSTRAEAEVALKRGRRAHEHVASRDDMLALIAMARAQHAVEGT